MAEVQVVKRFSGLAVQYEQAAIAGKELETARRR